MNKQQVERIQNHARKLMISEGKISLGKLKLKKNSLEFYYYYIFEDANFHALNRDLEEKGIFKEETEKDSEIYNDYIESKGKTWKLTTHEY